MSNRNVQTQKSVWQLSLEEKYREHLKELLERLYKLNERPQTTGVFHVGLAKRYALIWALEQVLGLEPPLQ